jgi:hypothetical protein
MTPRISVLIFFLVSILWAVSASAAKITATPGTYELLEGKSMQFDARGKGTKSKPTQFEWEVIAGKGARLLNSSTARVVFVAPGKISEDVRNFSLQLTSHYAKGQKPSKAQINIRVHKKTKKVIRHTKSPWLHGRVGFGYGYLWGGWWPHPPVIIIPPPPPGVIWPPEEIPPVAVPLPEDPSFGDWAKENPGVAEPYLGDADMAPEPLPTEPSAVELPIAETEPPIAVQPIEPVPEVSIEPAPGPELSPEPMPTPTPEPEVVPEPMPEPMDIPEPMDMPMMDIPLDIGGFD